MKIAYSDVYKYSLPPGHRFPMMKYELIGEQLIHEGIVGEENFFTPTSIVDEVVTYTHTPEYWRKLKEKDLTYKEARTIGFPISDQLIIRSKIISQGTIDCVEHAKTDGISMNVAGGTHHAFADRGGGFCLLNDFAIASNYILHHTTNTQILIVDLDVHQGDGTAHIFQNEPRVFTFSMHGRNNYPLKKQSSDLDIPLDDNINDETFLKILKDTLPALIEKIKPKHIFYLSGVDVLATDKLGRLRLSIEGCLSRDEYVFQQCKYYNIPVSVSMGGGYSKEIKHIVNAHTNTFRAAMDVFF